jgi:hypothetical protein
MWAAWPGKFDRLHATEEIHGDTVLGLYILYGSLEFLYRGFDLLFRWIVTVHVSMRGGGSRATLNILLSANLIVVPAIAADP